MSEQERALPSRPNLRFLKVEAKRRQAAGEFTTLHDAQLAIAREHGQPSWAALKRLVESRSGHALTQLRWVVARFAGADEATWVAPDDHEFRQHFDEQFLGVIPPERLVSTLTPLAARLREELVITEDTPTHVQARIDDGQLQAVVAAEPPHRLIGLRIYRAGGLADPRIAEPTSQTAGEVPVLAADVASRSFAELGLVGLALAGGSPGGPVWTVARGWADLDRAETLRTDHRFPAYGVAKLITATAVLRLVADGSVDLDTRIRELLAQPNAELHELVAGVTGSSYSDVATRLVLEPLGMTGSGFVRPVDVVTGYTLNEDGLFGAVDDPTVGLWTTAADLVRFGLTWSSLLPDALAAEAVTPQADLPGGGHMGLGWPLDRAGAITGSPGRGPGGSVSLVVRLRDNQTQVAMTSRRMPVEPINGRLLRAMAAPSHP
jgi:hypothetical protein